jgi:hypothetical protein
MIWIILIISLPLAFFITLFIMLKKESRLEIYEEQESLLDNNNINKQNK